MLRFAIAPPPTDLSIFVAMVIMRNYITIVVNILCTSINCMNVLSIYRIVTHISVTKISIL